MDRNAESSRDDTPGMETRLARLRDVALRLRTLAFVLLVVGFGGAIAAGTAPVDPDSIYSYVFFAGVACAIVAIYLGLFGSGDTPES